MSWGGFWSAIGNTGLATGSSGGHMYLSSLLNRGSAERAQSFAERMSSSEWQRGVIDMKAAGINPILAFGQGGASSPGGTALPTSGGQDFSNSARDYSRLSNERKLMDASLGETAARIKKTEAETDATTAFSFNQKLKNSMLKSVLDGVGFEKNLQRITGGLRLLGQGEFSYGEPKKNIQNFQLDK